MVAAPGLAHPSPRNWGIAACGLRSDVSGQDVDAHQDTYHLLTLFGEVFEKVRADYVAPVEDRDLVDNALNGMLTGLDPHSSYMDSQAVSSDMQITTKGEFGGLGLEVTSDSGLVKVISPIDDTPAARAGMKAGDLILSLDGKSVEGLTLERCRGPDARRRPAALSH